MRFIALDSETDFEGWRGAARGLVLNHIAPSDVTWAVAGSEPELFGSAAPLSTGGAGATFKVSARFVELAQTAILHRDPQRFARLYRLLWRLQAQRELLAVATDPDVALLQGMAKAVHRDQHKMKAFVRFREIIRGHQSRFVAWFEPEHHIVESTATFFVRRFADMAWSILTPDICSHWDGHMVGFTPGVGKAEAPSEDRLEETWLRYYASIFNPARLKVNAMRAEMPKKYWRNLPEAALIKPLIDGAGRRTGAMIAGAATEPHKAQIRRPALVHSKPDAGDIAAMRDEASACRACPLWGDATQTVFGEGPSDARVMLVGEQPGDTEDLAGRPFIGPAGRMLDRALREAGIVRDKVYLTNAVKHFKFVPRGKIRLHQTPATSEIKACRQWYERERQAINPGLIVAMGATAAYSVFGRKMPVNQSRGRLMPLDDRTRVLVTAHPSYLLRPPDEDARTREYRRLVDDLRIVAEQIA
jgi:probable DNA metabolism protein